MRIISPRRRIAAAALVSLNGHIRFRRSPNFAGRSFLSFSNWEGMAMRIFTASVIIIAAVSLGTPAFVQAQGATTQPEAQTPPAQSNGHTEHTGR
jgi:hypothetical protein